jgi:hypothetical protein
MSTGFRYVDQSGKRLFDVNRIKPAGATDKHEETDNDAQL